MVGVVDELTWSRPVCCMLSTDAESPMATETPLLLLVYPTFSTSFVLSWNGTWAALPKVKKMDNQNDSLEEQTVERLDSASTPSEQMIQKDKLNIVRNMINELPEKQRSCLQLRDIEGKAYKEIASILGITEEQVKVNIFRARQTVKQRFQQFDSYGL